ncbi:MAG TPA: hypothetical protein VFU17_12260 [Candidatus Limnocylindrales bacterium]|nr:hypothetical protein [Candidatus Limnocylindrales bacterium]
MIPRCTVLLAGVVLLAAACGGRSGTDDPLSSAIEATPSPATLGPSPAATEARATETAPSTARPAVTQSDTAWGRIWDALPRTFPVYPGAVETELDAPVSAAFTAGDANPDEIVTWMQQQLELATYSTEALSGPLEDGGFVIDSVGDAGCRIETTVTPAGGLTLVSVRFGADCPFE